MSAIQHHQIISLTIFRTMRKQMLKIQCRWDVLNIYDPHCCKIFYKRIRQVKRSQATLPIWWHTVCTSMENDGNIRLMKPGKQERGEYHAYVVARLGDDDQNATHVCCIFHWASDTKTMTAFKCTFDVSTKKSLCNELTCQYNMKYAWFPLTSNFIGSWTHQSTIVFVIPWGVGQLRGRSIFHCVGSASRNMDEIRWILKTSKWYAWKWA